MTIRTEEAPEVGKGVVGAVTSVVGRIGGRNAVIARALGSMRRGAITHADGVRLAEAAQQACDLGLPFIFFVASSGADVQDGIASLHGWGRAAAAISRCSGQVPVIAAATGPVVSGPALLLGLSDLVVMNSEAVAFVSGPQMVAEFTGIQISIGELGGTASHATASGLCAVESDDVDGTVAELLEYLPSNTDEVPPLAPVHDSVLRATPELRSVIPDRKAAGYDARDVVRTLCDDGEFREVWPRWAGQMVTAFARLGGMPVGFVANQPRILAGTLDIASTILDRVKIAPYNGIQGISLLPLLDGTCTAVARDSMVIEDDHQRAIFGLPSGPRLRTLVTQRWRMTIAHDDPYGELYDLLNDPHEMDNVFDDAAYRSVRAELMEKLAYREMELADRSPLPTGRA